MSTLAETFNRVAAIVPEVRGVLTYDLPGNRKATKALHFSTTPVKWNLRILDEIPGWIAPISAEEAEYIIVGSCVQWLQKRATLTINPHAIELTSDGVLIDRWEIFPTRTVAIALLLAVERHAASVPQDQETEGGT